MAIEFQEENSLSLKRAGGFLVILMVLAAGAYFLFFASAPAIEKVIPLQLQTASELSQVNFESDLQAVVEQLPPRGKLRNYASEPAGGSFGRLNPFIKF